jgi:hypothetical protein
MHSVLKARDAFSGPRLVLARSFLFRSSPAIISRIKKKAAADPVPLNFREIVAGRVPTIISSQELVPGRDHKSATTVGKIGRVRRFIENLSQSAPYRVL